MYMNYTLVYNVVLTLFVKYHARLIKVVTFVYLNVLIF